MIRLPRLSVPPAPRPAFLPGEAPQRPDPGHWPAPRRAHPLRRAALASAVDRIRALLAAPETLPQAALLRPALARAADAPALRAAALALAADAALRTLGLRPHDGQLAAAWAMLDGHLVEMPTGEGKSLAAALAAAAGALGGVPVHVFTANDYLVVRDAEVHAPLYRALGLEVATVTAPLDGDARRRAYAQPVVYATASEVAFDDLRDRVAQARGAGPLQRYAASFDPAPSEPPRLRGLGRALIDEADGLLIDEARMPLVLSRADAGDGGRAEAWRAHALAGRLAEGVDFERRGPDRGIVLTAAGRAHVERLTARLAGSWRNRRQREEALVGALTARHVLQRDRDYVVVAGADGPRVQIVDPFGGRTQPGRRWSRGLHALVAMKEGCRPEPAIETLAQTTYQAFFRRYLHLGGMSGTLHEARAELAAAYGLDVVTVAPRRPNRLHLGPTRLFADDAARRAAVVARAAPLSAAGRPVLVGTDTVDEALRISACLAAAGLPHAVLHARNEADEAAIIAAAGEAGRITVATRMAGRGTHIGLSDAALAAGGLHVIDCQWNAARRHDRQLAGRAARQGQPGSAEKFRSLAAPRWRGDRPGRLLAALARWRTGEAGTVRWPAAGIDAACRLLQHIDGARATRQRRNVFLADAERERGLPF